jgi:hypothetical protein
MGSTVTLKKRDRRALMILGVAVVLFLSLWLALPQSEETPVVASAETVSSAGRHLAKVRQIAATLPVEERAAKDLTGQLAEREKGLLQADTTAQALAQLSQIARRVAGAQDPPIDIRNIEVGKAQPLSESYDEVAVPLNFVCRIHQLVNFLADVTAQPELLAAGSLRVSSADAKEKTVNVRLVLSGVARKRVEQPKRGGGLL